jgi:hypothetical protein
MTTGSAQDATAAREALESLHLLRILALDPQVALSGLAWRVAVVVLTAPTPVSARAVARCLGGARGAGQRYPGVKAVVRALLRAGILGRTPEGLWFVFGMKPARVGPRGRGDEHESGTRLGPRPGSGTTKINHHRENPLHLQPRA